MNIYYRHYTNFVSCHIILENRVYDEVELYEMVNQASGVSCSDLPMPYSSISAAFFTWRLFHSPFLVKLLSTTQVKE